MNCAVCARDDLEAGRAAAVRFVWGGSEGREELRCHQVSA